MAPSARAPVEGDQRGLFIAATPAMFVLLWSTGFLAVKLGIPHADPLTFLAIRFTITVVIMVAFCAAMGVLRPADPAVIGHAMVVGVLAHATYISGVAKALEFGVSAGVVALVAGLQPLITAALVGRLLGETVSMMQWLGLGLGFAGVTLVVFEKVSMGVATAAGFGFAALALAAMTAGTLYQKRFCGGHDMRTSLAYQFIAAAIVTFAVAATFEDMNVAWTGEFIFALGWLAVVVSIGAFALLMAMLRRGQMARVTSLFYLTPPTTAVLGYFLFGETLGALALFGMAVAITGVALANR